MNRFIIVVAAGVACAWTGSAAQAQIGGYPSSGMSSSANPFGGFGQFGTYGSFNRPNYGPNSQPGLSPYLNLLRGGSTSANYFLGTIPETERRTNERSLQNSFQSLEQRQELLAEEGALAPLAGTGHPTAFSNYGFYFNQGPRISGLSQSSLLQQQPRR